MAAYGIVIVVVAGKLSLLGFSPLPGVQSAGGTRIRVFSRP